MSAAAEAYFVSRTMRAIEVLTFQAASAPEVARALQVHPRTARRLLDRLAAEGWLTRSEGRRRTYAPSLRIVALAAQLSERTPLVQLGTGVVEGLHREAAGVASLAIPSYRSALSLVVRGAPVDAHALVPAHAGAAGKVLLAHRHPWRESVLQSPLAAVTPATITDPDAVRAEAAAIRARGYATERGEHRPGTDGIAAPVRNAGGEVVAALALTRGAGDPADEPATAAMVIRHADALSRALLPPEAGHRAAR